MKLFLRLQTARGPRTIVRQGIASVDAYAIADSAWLNGGEGAVQEDGHMLSMRDHLQVHAARRKLLRSVNVIPIKQKEK